MISAILFFAGKMFSGLWDTICSIAKALGEHPVATAVVVGVLASNYATYHFTTNAVDASVRHEFKVTVDDLNEKLKVANADRDSLNLKASALEISSRKDAIEAAAAIADKSKKLAEVSAKYDAKVTAERLATYQITVAGKKGGPEEKVTVTVDNTNTVICNKFHAAFTDIINEMIDEVNKPLPFTSTALGATK